MFWIAWIKCLVVFCCLIFFCLPVFAINSRFSYNPSDNPPSSCVVFYFKGDSQQRLCSGDIVSKNKLLTAGYCALKADEDAVVRCSDQDQRELLVKGQLVHPLYTEGVSPFDQALLQVESDFFTFEPALLPKNDSEIYSLMEGECAAFGYGLDSFKNSGSFLGTPVLVDINSSLGFEIGVIGSLFPVEKGDRSGGLFCRNNSRDKQDKWIRVATLSQISDIDGERVALAAPLVRPIVNWIERYLEEELPRVASFRGTRSLRELPLEEMETPEECISRLVIEVASDSTGGLEQILETEIVHQCGLELSQEFLNPLLEKHRRNQPEPTRHSISHQEIEEIRRFIKQQIEISRRGISRLGIDPDLYCSYNEYYKYTPCGRCELEFMSCLSQLQQYELASNRNIIKSHCVYGFTSCLNELRRGVSRVQDLHNACVEVIKRLPQTFKTRKAAYEQFGEQTWACMKDRRSRFLERGEWLLEVVTNIYMKNAIQIFNYYSKDSERCEQIIKRAVSFSSYLTDNLPQIISEQCQSVRGLINNEIMDYNECASRLEAEGKGEREVAAECVLSNLNLPSFENFKLWFLLKWDRLVL